MPLKKITAHISCDMCDAAFTETIDNDRHHEPEGTVFEIVTAGLDFVDDGTHVLKEAGFHDGQFYCPDCWTPKSEELFIADIKAGKITAEQLEGIDPEYMKYLPVKQLEHQS